MPGPNFIWSIDGHDKLHNHGIDIYVGIDAHARYVMWCYVGISSHTAVSVLRQYLQTVRQLEQHPRFIRSDRGNETPLACAAHHYLHKAIWPDIEVKQCWIYGKSTANQRIESWWSKFAESFVYRIQVNQSFKLIVSSFTEYMQAYFNYLTAEGHYHHNIPSKVALLALYMPWLRSRIAGFVQMWNSHTIKSQRKRLNAIVGKPYMLYNYPADGIINHGLSVDIDSLDTIEADVEDYGT